jgi:CheY-like chemotaxis protein
MGARQGRILLVEDDPALAGMMVDLLHAADYEVDGPHASVSDGVTALASHFADGAVLDLHRSAADASVLRDDLAAYGIPFLDCGEKDAGEPREMERRLLPWLRRMRH